MQDPLLILRDVHQPPAPSWWPPAPGWWLLAGLLLVVALVTAWFVTRRRRRLKRMVAMFEDTVVETDRPPAQIAAMSELLRRAARQRDAMADRLEGEAWLRFLDDRKPGEFTQGVGRLLLDGAYRRDADLQQVAALRRLVRTRFLEWMTR